MLCSYAQSDKGNFAPTVSTITVSVDPEGSGTATGGGNYENGSTAVLSATANPGYFFLNWKKSDVVSHLSPYSFTVEDDASYIARFSQIPSTSIVVGQPTSTLEPLPTNTYYNYSLTQQIFTAAELGLTTATDLSSVTFYNTGTAKTRNLTIYMVNTNKSSFQNATDWIVPTEADKVFSGRVEMAVGMKTIYFNSAFTYDGSSNIAMIVDDNTGSYSRGMMCRTSSAHNRTLYVYKDDTNFDPFHPSGYEGTVSESINQVIFGVASYDYTVSVSTNPEDGIVSVDEGPFYYGQLCTVTAAPIGDNVFYYWAYNGERVSSDATYTFQVTSSRDLVAYFGPALSVTVMANPEEGGTVSGGGNLGIGQSCSVSAEANEGYLFTNWTLYDSVMWYYGNYDFVVEGESVLCANFEPVPENSIVVGQCPTTHTLLPTYSYYNYSLTQQIYTADEIGRGCNIMSVAFFNATYEKTRTLDIYMVNTDKERFESNNDWIVVTNADKVFSGTVTFYVNSWNDIFLDVPFEYDGQSNLAIIINDKTGEWANQHMACRVYEADGNQAIRIYNDNNSYNPLAPQGYDGVRLAYKNQIILGLEGYEHVAVETFAPAVYPNPAEDMVFVEGEGIQKVEVFNVMGQLVDVIEPEGARALQISIGDYKPAVYLLRIHSANGVSTRRFVKQNPK
jgi:hypothetical protein